MEDILKAYLRKLTNITVKNRSIYLPKLSKYRDIDLYDLDFNFQKSSFEILEKLITSQASIKVSEEIDSRDANSNLLSRRLRKIQKEERFIFEESGAKDLYLGYPFVEGKLLDNSSIRCPLLFFPVKIEYRNASWYLKRRDDVNVTFNKSFLLAYSFFNQVPVSEELLESSFEDFSSDFREYRTELYEFLKKTGLELNFNQDLFKDALQSFTQYNKKVDFEHSHDVGQLKLYPQAVVGIFPQSGSYLVPDYQLMEANLPAKNLEDFFMSKVSNIHLLDTTQIEGSNYIQAVKEEKTFTPFDVDIFQENALKAVKKGLSIVVQGPPGTGKSQLISNLIGDFVAEGKKVLMVCQKRAALDVVYSRLKSINADPFAVVVHDFKADRKDIYNKLASQIDAIDDYSKINNGLDSIFLEREFVDLSRKIESLSAELEEYRRCLFDQSEYGGSIKELYLEADLKAKSINLKQEFRNFTRDRIEPFKGIIKQILSYSLILEDKFFLWKERTSFSNYTFEDKKELEKSIHSIPEEIRVLEESSRSILHQKISIELLLRINEFANKVEELLSIIDNGNIYAFFKRFNDASYDFERVEDYETGVLNCFSGQGVENSLNKKNLGSVNNAIDEYLTSRNGILANIKYFLFSKTKDQLKNTASENSLKVDRKDVKILQKKLENRLNLEHLFSEIQDIEWLPEIKGDSLYEETWVKWFSELKIAFNAVSRWSELKEIQTLLDLPSLDFDLFNQKLTKLVKISSEAKNKVLIWRNSFTTSQILILQSRDEKLLSLMLEQLDQQFENMIEYDRLKDSLSKIELDVIAKVVSEGGESTEVIKLFENSIKLAWIDLIETKYPILRMVSTNKLQHMENELQDAISKKKQISAEIFLMRARENTYYELEYNRLNNLVTYRDLKHQVTKKKKIWPLRKTMSSYFDEVFKLIPCWMVSPESASAIFPMKEIFDLVIFDEASQCYAEKGIPAIYRGKQIVIAGDSKQLQPNDLYSVRFEEEIEEEPDLEIDSLLDLSSKYLFDLQLREHYRSNNIDLIAFSNQVFYESNLRVLPDFNTVAKGSGSIDYVKVEGVWEKNTNLIEAKKVTEIVIDHLKSNDKKDIGVITFNYMQQNLIQELLEKAAIEENILLPDFLFVKNIENVQGDERDIIIFSIGYAPTLSGKFNVNFGSLNAEGGENRLNVAITRAKSKIYIITSILPHHLDVENTKNKGPKIFKKYLEYAWKVSEGEFEVGELPQSINHKNWYLNSSIVEELNKIDPDLEVKQNTPFGDLSFYEEGTMKRILLTDDDKYYSSLSTKDIHAYYPEYLRAKNWKFKRVYARQYWRNIDKTMSDIRAYINN